MKKNFGHIGVLLGGYSSEREISLKSGKAVYDALEEAGHHVSKIDIVSREDDIGQMIQAAGIDVAFIALHGALGEDGTIQSLLEMAGVPYTGSGVDASRIAINKISTQNVLRKKNFPVPIFTTVFQEDSMDEDALLTRVDGMPVVVKPAAEGSSLGVTIVHKRENFKKAVMEAFRYGSPILVDHYIQGRELTVGILSDEPLPVVEIRPTHDFFDFTAKYQKGLTDYLVPAPLSAEITTKVQQMALAAYEAVGCRDFSRVDVILDRKMNPYILEINTIPGFTATSLLPMAAQEAGYNFTQLCEKIIALAYEKKKQAKHSLGSLS